MAEQRFVDWDGLVYYDGKIKTYISDLSQDFLKAGGETDFVNLPRPCFENLNYVYKITEEFTSNVDFEQPNIVYNAGSIVQVADFDDDSTYKYVVLYEPQDAVTHDDIKDFATQEYVNVKIAEAQLDDADVDLSNYYTKLQTDAAIQSAVDDIEIPTVPTKVSELENDAGYSTTDYVDDKVKVVSAHISATRTATGVVIHYSDIDTTGDTYLNDGIDGKDGTIIYYSTLDTSNEVFSEETKTFTSSDFETLAPPTYQMPNLNDLIITKNSDYWRVTVKGSDYVAARLVARGRGEKGDTADLSNYYNKEEVNSLIDGIDIPEADVDLSNYYTKEEVEGLIPDTSNFITSIPDEYITDEELSKKGYVTDISGKADKSDTYTKSEVDGLIPTDYLTADALNEYAKTEDIPTDYLVASDLIEYAKTEDLPSLEGYAKTSDIPDVSNFITMSDVESKKYLVASDIEGKLDVDTYNTDKSTFALKSDIPSVPTKTSELTNDSGFLTEHQDISGKVDKTTYNSDKVTFSLKSEVEAALGDKADNVLFTTNLIVHNAVGGFVNGDSVQNMTLSDILVRLLGLAENLSVLEYIKKYQIPAYSGLATEELTENEFAVLDGNDCERTESGLYEIYEDDTLVEAGYQVQTEAGDDGNSPRVLIPAAAEVVALHQFDDGLTQTWGEIPNDGTYFQIIGTETKMINGQQVEYTVYEWNEEIQGGSIFVPASWRFEIKL